MSNERSDRDWVSQRIEAGSDGTLDRLDDEQLEAAMRRDPALRLAIQRARRLRQELGRVRLEPVPLRLLWRLLRIPASNRRSGRRGWRAFAMPAGAAAAALIAASIALWPSREPDPGAVALHEFVVAINYLQRSTAVAHSKVQGQVGSGVLEAINASRESLLERSEDSAIENGG